MARSFDSDPAVIATDQLGQLVHRKSLEQSARMVRRLYAPRSHVWTMVGNGLSNQTFIEGPGGIIVIDTGESDEEMLSALAELRLQTNVPIVAVIYTHFHYVSGTRAILEMEGRNLPIYAHHQVVHNLSRVSTEIAPSYSRGLVHQFGVNLPRSGPDGLVNVGLGLYFRNPDHAPFTRGFVPPTENLVGGETLTIAGLKVEFAYAPSDSDDSLTLWFPELGVCVQNIVWPTLFNIFPIRGEAYRDPQVLLAGIDHIISLNCDHLLGTHGPPISGAAEIRRRVLRYRDSIQFLWDQTIRGINRGLDADELAHSVVLPSSCDEDYITTEFYGVAEHHVRQILSGVIGWFDGNPAKLFPLEPMDRANRMVVALGGEGRLIQMIDEARVANDLRWALELATFLARRTDASELDRKLLADVLRDIGYRSSAANIRNWCITKALDLDGSSDMTRFRTHRLNAGQLATLSPYQCLHLLRVLLDFELAKGIDHHVGFTFADGTKAGLHVRNCVAVASAGEETDSIVSIAYGDWIRVLTGTVTLSDLIQSGTTTLSGNTGEALRALSCFDIKGLKLDTAA